MEVPDCPGCAIRDEENRRLRALYVREQANNAGLRLSLEAAERKVSELAAQLPGPPTEPPAGLPSSDWITEGADQLTRQNDPQEPE